MILGVAQVDLDFNVNGTSGSDERIVDSPGGHADAADGSRLAIVATTLASRAGPKLVKRVGCITTPGSTVDVVVTETCIAVNPRRQELAQRLKAARLPVCAVENLRRLASRDMPQPPPVNDGRIAAVVQYRNGTVIDLVRVVNHGIDASWASSS